MKISIKVANKVVTATLSDSKITQNFISLLPLTRTMYDLFKREKFANLPRAISKEVKRTHTYEVGDVAYWPPGQDVAIFYRHDGQEIPDPGIIINRPDRFWRRGIQCAWPGKDDYRACSDRAYGRVVNKDMRDRFIIDKSSLKA